MKKSVKILIVILCLTIVGLVTFIVIDKVINKNGESNVVNTISNSNDNDNKAEGNNTGFLNTDFYGDWNNDEDTQLTINNDETFQADHYTASSTIFGDYTINGENIQFICKKNDDTYNKKWNGKISKDSNGNYRLKVNLYDEDKILSKVNKNDTNTTKQKFNSEPERMSTEDALNLGEKMYKEATNCYEKMSDIHSNLSTQNIGTTEKMEKIEDRTTMENIKKVLVNDAYNDLLEYFHAEEKDGEYYVNTGGMGSNPLYKETKALTVKNIESDKIVYTATSVYEVVRNSSATNETETKDYEFVLTKINGEWKVTEFTIPY